MTNATKSTPTVKDNGVGPELLATEIVKLAQAARVFRDSRLKERAILVLLSDSSKLPMATIKRLLDAAEALAREYVKG